MTRLTCARLAAFAALAIALAPARAHADDVGSPRGEGGAREDEGEAVHGSKGVGVHSPRGRSIYREEATFAEAVDSRRRIFVIEAVAGWGPEGNLGLVLGFLPKALHGVEFYGGAGVEVNPAYHLSGAVRFLFNIAGYRPYAGVGYFYKDAFEIDTYAHNVFAEAGYSFKLGPTYHVTAGAGIARVLVAGVRHGSVLRTPEVDPRRLQEQVDSVPGFRPMVTLRLSHAF